MDDVKILPETQALWDEINGKKETSSPLLSGVKRGYGNLVSTAGNTFGVQGLEKYGEAIVKANPAALNTWQEKLSSPDLAFKESVGEQLPQLGEQLVATAGGAMLGRYLGGVLGSAAGPVGTAAGAVAGGYIGQAATNLIHSYGGSRQEQQESNGQVDNAKAATNAVANTLLEIGLPGGKFYGGGVQGLLRNLITGEGKDAAKDVVAKSVLKEMGKGALKTSLQEAGEEALQRPIERWAADKPVMSMDTVNESASNAISAFLGTLPFGAGTHAMNTVRQNTILEEKDAAAKSEADRNAFLAQQKDVEDRYNIWSAEHTDQVGKERLAHYGVRQDAVKSGLIHENMTFDEVNARVSQLEQGQTPADITKQTRLMEIDNQIAEKTAAVQSRYEEKITDLQSIMIQPGAAPEVAVAAKARIAEIEGTIQKKTASQTAKLLTEKAALSVEVPLTEGQRNRNELSRTAALTKLTAVRDDMQTKREAAAEVTQRTQLQQAMDSEAANRNTQMESAFAARDQQSPEVKTQIEQAYAERQAEQLTQAQKSKESVWGILNESKLQADLDAAKTTEERDAILERAASPETYTSPMQTEANVAKLEQVKAVVATKTEAAKSLADAYQAASGKTAAQAAAWTRNAFKGVDITDKNAVAALLRERANDKKTTTRGTILDALHQAAVGVSMEQFDQKAEQPAETAQPVVATPLVAAKQPKSKKVAKQPAAVAEQPATTTQPKTLPVKDRLLIIASNENNPESLRQEAGAHLAAMATAEKENHMPSARVRLTKAALQFANNVNKDLKSESGIAPQEELQGHPAQTEKSGSINHVDKGHRAAAQQILDAIDKNDLSDYGLRVIPGEYEGDISIGDVLPNSRVWIDEEITDDELPGTSAADIKSRTIREVIKAIRNIGADAKPGEGGNGFYYGNRVVLIKGDRVGAGEDVGEGVFKSAKVVGIWLKPTNGYSEVEPNESIANNVNKDLKSESGIAPQEESQVNHRDRNGEYENLYQHWTGSSWSDLPLHTIWGEGWKQKQQEYAEFTRKNDVLRSKRFLTDADKQQIKEHNEWLRGFMEWKNSLSAVRRDPYTSALRPSFDYLAQIIGHPEGWSIEGYVAGSKDAAGAFNQARRVISLAYNAVEQLSVQAHEGFHYLEHNVLSPRELSVLSNAFRRGGTMYKQLVAAARNYDQQHSTMVADTIQHTPAETRAYAYQFWKMGALKLGDRTTVQKVFDTIRTMMYKVMEHFGSHPEYKTVGDIFSAIDRGQFAADVIKQTGVGGWVSMQDGAMTPMFSLTKVAPDGSDFVEPVRAGSQTFNILQHYGQQNPSLVNKIGNFLHGATAYSRGSRGLTQLRVDTFATPLDNAARNAGFGNVFKQLQRVSNLSGTIITDAFRGIDRLWIKGPGVFKARLYQTLNLDTPELQQLTMANSFLNDMNYYQKPLSELRDIPEIAQKYGDNIENQPWYPLVKAARDGMEVTLMRSFMERGETMRRNSTDEEFQKWLIPNLKHTEELISTGYIPLLRQGKYSVSMYYMPVRNEIVAGQPDLPVTQRYEMPRGEDGQLITRFFETEADARAYARDLKEEFGGIPGVALDTDWAGGAPSIVAKEAGGQFTNNKLNINRFAEIAESIGKPLTTEQRGRLAQLMINADSIFQNRVQRREGKAGANDDALRAISTFITNTANNTAREHFSRRIAAAMSKFEILDENRSELDDLRTTFAEYEGMGEEDVRAVIKTQSQGDYNTEFKTLDQYNRMKELEAHGWDKWNLNLDPKNYQQEASEYYALKDKVGGLSPEEAERYLALSTRNPNTGMYQDAANKLINYLNTPQSEAFSTLRQLAAVNFIGGSISSALMNASSVPMFLMPYLHQHAGWAAYPITARWYKTFLSNDLLRSTIMNNDISELEKAIVEKRTEDAGLTLPQAQALVRAFREEVVSDTQIFDTFSFVKHGPSAGSMLGQRAMALWMSPFRVTEMMNRVTAFMSAYEIGEQYAKKTGEELYQFSQDAVNASQGVYNPTNRPPVARTPLGHTMMTFKMFPIMMIELLVRLPAKQRTIALGTMVMAAGVNGIPLKDDLFDIIDTVANRIFGQPLNMNRLMHNYIKDATEATAGVDLSRLVLSGPLDYYLGGSIGSRMSLSDVIPGTRMFTPGASMAQSLLEIGGVVPSEIKGWVDGAGAIGEGDYLDAVKLAAPSVLKNIGKAYESIKTGEVRDRNGNMVAGDVSPWETTLMAAGFSMSRAAYMSKAASYTTQYNAFATEFKNKMFNHLIDGMIENDSQKVDDVWGAVGDWNDANPEQYITYRPGSIRNAVAMRGLTPDQRMLKKVPKAWRSGLASDLEGLYEE